MDNRPHSFRIGLAVGGGFAPNGDPIPETVQWGNPILCRYESGTSRCFIRTPNGDTIQRDYYVVTKLMADNLTGGTIRLFSDKKGIELVTEKIVLGQPTGRQLMTTFYL